MKKFVLPVIILLAFVFSSPQKLNAQKTDSECFREYQDKEYKCLQGFNDCIWPCASLGSAEASDSCRDTCSAQDKTCSSQASSDLKACKAEDPKNKEDVPSEAESKQDCRKIFDKESYKCLTDSTACSIACGDETKRPDGGGYFNSGDIYQKCMKASDCDGKSSTCNEQALENFRACGKSDQQPKATEEKKESLKTKKEDEPYLLKFFGINPFETWLRLKNLGEAGGYFARATDEMFFSTKSVDLNYEDGMTRVEVDSTSLLGPDLTMTSPKEIKGAQIRLPGQYEYQNLQPNQNIPNDSYIRINSPTSFVIGGEDVEVSPVNEGGQIEFLVQKSKENESVDFIESRRDELDNMTVKIGSIVDYFAKHPSISPEIEEKAWQVTPVTEHPAGEKLIEDVPGTSDTKIYSWESNSGAVIKSNDWENVEFKEPVTGDDGSTVRTVLLKEGEVEVKVKNDKPLENRFQVKAADFLDAVSVETHYLVGYNSETKRGSVIVYEGKVEVKARDGKVITVEPKDGKPGVTVITRKISVTKLTMVGLAALVIIGGIVWLVKRKFPLKLTKKI